MRFVFLVSFMVYLDHVFKKIEILIEKSCAIFSSGGVYHTKMIYKINESISMTVDDVKKSTLVAHSNHSMRKEWLRHKYTLGNKNQFHLSLSICPLVMYSSPCRIPNAHQYQIV